MGKKYKGIDKKNNKIINKTPPPGADGTLNFPLEEEVPEFAGRSSDHIITGKYNNNTMIVLGRDRWPQEEETYFDPESKSKKKRTREQLTQDPLSTTLVSGYSDHQGAGAIDIVVGRGAPFPTKSKNKPLAPIFTTITDKAGHIRPKLPNQESHPKIAMDAARIYISQMSDIDKWFAIDDGRDKVTIGPKVDTSPSSAIMIKADRCRIHSRRDIKIVAGGDRSPDGQNIDSNGYRIDEKPKIHLMVGNGAPGVAPQQPVPLGDNLVQCIERIYQVQESFVKILDNVLKAQAALNTAFAHSIRVGPYGPTAMDPVSEAMNVVHSYSNTVDLFNLYFLGTLNIQFDRVDFLTKAGTNSIRSRNITVN